MQNSNKAFQANKYLKVQKLYIEWFSINMKDDHSYLVLEKIQIASRDSMF